MTLYNLIDMQRVNRLFVLRVAEMKGWLGLVLFCSLSGVILNAQEFQGQIRVATTQGDHQIHAVLTLETGRTMYEVWPNAEEYIRVTHEADSGQTLMLRRKGELTYGFRRAGWTPSSFHYEEKDLQQVSITPTGEYQWIDSVRCTGYHLTSSAGEAIAYVVPGHKARIAGYFPEFLNGSTPYELGLMRKAADQLGLIMLYEEKRAGEDSVSIRYDTEVLETVNTSAFFSIPDEYTVLSESALRMLVYQAQTTSEARDQLEEFQTVFGKH